MYFKISLILLYLNFLISILVTCLIISYSVIFDSLLKLMSIFINILINLIGIRSFIFLLILNFLEEIRYSYNKYYLIVTRLLYLSCEIKYSSVAY